jgi:hypothetical protein
MRSLPRNARDSGQKIVQGQCSAGASVSGWQSCCHRRSGGITLEPGTAGEYARDHGFDTVTAILDGDGCVKLLCAGDWVATAQPVTFVGRTGATMRMHALRDGYSSIPLSRSLFRLRSATRARSRALASAHGGRVLLDGVAPFGVGGAPVLDRAVSSTEEAGHPVRQELAGRGGGDAVGGDGDVVVGGDDGPRQAAGLLADAAMQKRADQWIRLARIRIRWRVRRGRRCWRRGRGSSPRRAWSGWCSPPAPHVWRRR